MKFNRDIDELERQAILWWPEDLLAKNASISILPKLIKTQRDFLHILSLSKNSPVQVIDLLKATQFPANLFVKHLCVLSDYGGEPLQRLGRSFDDIFPNNIMEYVWNGEKQTYRFKGLPIKSLGNTKLKIDGNGLNCDQPLTPIYEDIIMLLLHGSTSTVAHEAALDKCEIGVLLGKEEQLEDFIDQRYIVVSRITGGATSNTLGQLTQQHVVKVLVDKLGQGFEVVSNGTIQLAGYDKASGMPFDIVIRKNKEVKELGIEISFQVTTNSTIERKAGQAADRQNLMHNNGNKIAYIIDGAGNFQRASAVSTICKHSDCTIAYSDDELNVLVEWIKNEYI
ncbi:hypothetical protein ACSTD7_17325 [Vibrio vulnificus]|uniref:restriction endonuclease n=1 Tax=Vibrio vulnificus TaxID=672 RepID=UPI0009B605CD|nr:restriction endonuclease [Vibrio vulnificus]ELS3716236.1 hypothetical protein [Vibrio fluvialis]EMA3773982.1 hypothetical protein [Vibrio cholerae]ELX9692734.1 hypothetical protein [Vibrio fluvialis]OQK51845.1 Type-2 restriction enzyme BanI [Vibrio vulnificus]HDY7978634.1 hypothetical protein [Vibrio vulnificus]